MRLSLTAAAVTAGLCLLVAEVALAASTQVPSTGVSLWRGTGKLSDSQGRVVDPATNVLTVLTPTNCPGIRDRIIARDALTRTTGTATYRCQVDLRALVTFLPNPTCPALPPPEGRTVDCPAGTTGAYTQTRSYTSAPYPTCAVLGEWTPAVPPAGICVPIPPPPTEQWTFCANEYATCSFTGTRRVRFGLNTSWVERDLAAVSGGVPCRIATFGADPVPGATKRCELLAIAEPTVPRACASRVCDVSWTPNGPADGFRIYYSRTDGTWANTPVQVAGTVTQTNVTMPETGIWYFAAKAFIGAEESPLSNVVVRDVQ